MSKNPFDIICFDGTICDAPISDNEVNLHLTTEVGVDKNLIDWSNLITLLYESVKTATVVGLLCMPQTVLYTLVT